MEPEEAGLGCEWCAECDDTPAAVRCEGCDEVFCRPCWGAQHRRGKRATHCIVALDESTMAQPVAPERGEGGSAAIAISTYDPETQANAIRPLTAGESSLDAEPEPEPEPEPERAQAAAPSGWPDGTPGRGASKAHRALAERCKFIPLRLSDHERDLLGYLEGTLHVSEYTDIVDVVSRYGVAARIGSQMEDFCAMESGLVVCKSFKKGAKLVQGDFQDNAELFQEAFEAGRRYKILNPQKMRNDYGKLMYMLQDWATSSAQRHMGFAATRPIITVHSFLSERGGLALLANPHLVEATVDVTKHSRQEAAEALEAKRRGVQLICDEHASSTCTVEDIQRCLESIADSNNYLNMNATPCVRQLLTSHSV